VKPRRHPADSRDSLTRFIGFSSKKRPARRANHRVTENTEKPKEK
jgi:hypothetical protein